MTDPSPRLSRRGMLTGGLAAVGGAAVASTATLALTGDDGPSAAAEPSATTVPFHGKRQAGVATAPQAHGTFVSLAMKPDVDVERFASVLRLLSQDAERLTEGLPALGDTEPELAKPVNRLTITFGFGHALFDKLGIADRRPADFTPVPEFEHDQLDEAWNGGDVLLQICADDPTTVSHAVRMCVKDARSIAEVKWVMRGFRQAPPVVEPGATPRNLMGQLDGTANPDPDDEGVVWRDGSDSMADGTTLVIRRIRAEMEAWDAVPPVSKEQIMGRRLDTGAPLTGESEHDEPDFSVTDHLHLPVIAPNSHIKRARLDDGRRIFRRAYNYDDHILSDGTGDAGLIFAAYQADIGTFVDIQAQLDAADMLNAYVTAVGSAEFLIPPGCEEGGWVGETLFG